MTTTTATALAVREDASVIEEVIAKGDLAQLTPGQRVSYYREVCRSLKLNELTRPFEYITLNGKLTLYTRKDCTDQLRGIRHVSVTKLERGQIGDVYTVTAYATDSSGRQDSSIGAVSIKGLGGEALANAVMKAETKAKRRVTLSLCGLGWTDESEIESIPSAQTVVVDSATGEILETRPAAQPIRERDVDDAPRRSGPERKSQPANALVTSEDDPMWTRWIYLKGEAELLGIRCQKVELPISRVQLQEEGAKVRKLVNAHHDKLTQEVLDAPSPEQTAKGDEWARNRYLVSEANRRQLAGVPTLNARSTHATLIGANDDLNERIIKYDEQQQALLESQAPS